MNTLKTTELYVHFKVVNFMLYKLSLDNKNKFLKKQGKRSLGELVLGRPGGPDSTVEL